MRYFALLDFQYVVLAVFTGIAAAILLHVAFGWPGASRRERKEPEHYADGLQIEKNRVPPILVFVYSAFLIWALAYLIVVGIKGEPF
jgi:hypothetical protein